MTGLFTIPPTVPFLDALAASLLQRCGAGPPDLSKITLFLPTRRACRAFQERVHALRGGTPALLPTLQPLGEADLDALFLEGEEEMRADIASLAPAMGGHERICRLARALIAARSGEISLPMATNLARELIRLIDQMQIERVSRDALNDVVPTDFASHFQETLSFLDILFAHWPDLLAEAGHLDPAERRARIIRLQIEQWRRHPPQTPVIVAGSTGSMPDTADLIEAVLRLPQGQVVLPGLDRSLSPGRWSRLEESHPQFLLRRLLTRLGHAREAVADWPSPVLANLPPAQAAARTAIIREAMAPARSFDEAVLAGAESAEGEAEQLQAAGLDGITLIEAPTPDLEAKCIALIMRETLELPGGQATAALVTPDRGLARRVSAALSRYGVEVDDSAGTALAHRPAGAWLDLTARLLCEPLSPEALLAVLKHPFAAFGFEPGQTRQLARGFEYHVLRSGAGTIGPDALSFWAEALGEVKTAMALGQGRARDMAAILGEVAQAREAVQEAAIAADGPASLVAVHLASAEAFARTPALPGEARCWQHEDGQAARQLFALLGSSLPVLERVVPSDYPDLLNQFLSETPVRPRYGAHPRLTILGLLEARLLTSDRVILGGLNEGSWPPDPVADPWLSRPLRRQIGLPTAERRLGQTAHDFAQAMGASEVFLTRSQRAEGAPTLAARWLQRLKVQMDLISQQGGDDASIQQTVSHPIQNGLRYLSWAEQLDRPQARQPVAPPAPAPPVAARPTRFSISDIGLWMRDPYALYAKRVLDLRPLSPLPGTLSAADRGSLIHEVLARFLDLHRHGQLPAKAEDQLIEMGEAAFDRLHDRGSVKRFWWPRFLRIAAWFIAQERERRIGGTAPSGLEVQGALEIPVPGGPIEIHGRADRIDRHADGSLEIIDYKTGSVPGKGQVAAGFEPQLPLEGLIAAGGGFRKGAEAMGSASVARLSYWQLTGRRDPADIIAFQEAGTLIDEARAGLERLAAAFTDEATPYLSAPWNGAASSDYRHLARVDEWAMDVDGQRGGFV